MKKFMLFVSLGFLSSLLKAAPVVMEAPISGYGTATTVAVSSSAFTMVPTAKTASTTGIYISNPSTHTIAGLIGNCTSTAIAVTVKPIALAPTTASSGISDRFFALNDNVCLWLKTSDINASTSIHYQEIKQ